ncbi:MAG: phage holin family protein [Synergistaceae bacterium]|nr:phage holin family protein [Synergistaceae bacterium]
MTEDFWNTTIDFICGSIIGLLSWFFGGRDGFLMVLIAFMVIDQCSGLAAGWVEHKLSSEVGFKGILKKCIILSFVGMAHLMDKYILVHTMIGDTEAIRNVVCAFYIANEGVSIIENSDRLGIPFPEYVREHFLNIRNSNKKKIQLNS